ncbi:TRAP transporter small permease [Bordetella bronchiseptica]|uniref:TRAP transporter small permease protein n=1 Tax=Bordetella bronchiseptica 253 TaxID=568707 RepID=A0A0C6P8Y4_BORBO|nr:TRAP transporter small permease [Bordetella bronchiseptica]SHQ26175.1 TRAP-type C4-dicarboxylate transport system, small permease component [Mycobacteroides abscessus subsp. abscessus]AWP73412.1 TRAP transporter small permease protein [Bordetella bronchiseptica]AWP78234.1 TRAP transporter small permease protein [Bordetella bronchiseptica]AZW10956.1 TRAP transporter small permease [Bordetella bronchiseptica]AZW20217.1 TRAP transporter small permease [Bordetella bronchiseptica]
MTLKKICTNANLDRVLLKIENSVMIVTYLILICLVGGETIRRAIFQEQATWGPEIAMYSFIWLSWFAMARHCRYGTNLGFTKIRNSLPAPARRVLEVIDAILWLAIGSVVFWSTAELISSNFVTEQMVMGTPIPAWIINLGVPLGWAFSMLRIVQRLWLVLFQWDFLENERTNNYLSA